MDILSEFVAVLKESPKEIIILISSYEPKAIFLHKDHVTFDWHWLIKKNFNLEYDPKIPDRYMINIYMEKCGKTQSLFTGGTQTIIKSSDGNLMFSGYSVFNVEKPRFSPLVDQKLLKKISNIACCEDHIIIKLTDGTIMGCGSNTYGELGLGGAATPRTEFTPIHHGFPGQISNIFCGNHRTFIKLEDGSLICCGNNNFGQLGLSDFINRNEFTLVPNDESRNTVEVICGATHTIIKLNDGRIMGCGSNNHGKLGLGSLITCVSEFRLIGQGLKNIDQIKCGFDHTFVKLIDGTIMCCGSGYFGQLGIGDDLDKTHFVKGNVRNVLEIICGNYHTILILTDGTLMATGYNWCGQLGIGDYDNRNKFTIIEGIPKDISEVSSSKFHTFIKLSNGTLMSCGKNDCGQLGHGDFKSRNRFMEIKDRSGKKFLI